MKTGRNWAAFWLNGAAVMANVFAATDLGSKMNFAIAIVNLACLTYAAKKLLGN